MDFTTVRENAARGYGRRLNSSQRGVRVGLIQRQVRVAMYQIGLSLDLRIARLALASEVFEREVLTFSQLSDDELIALDNANWEHVPAWLAEKYGEPGRLPGL